MIEANSVLDDHRGPERSTEFMGTAPLSLQARKTNLYLQPCEAMEWVV